MSMDLATIERTKYQRMWKESAYRQWSPGEASVEKFLSGVQWAPGETVVDLGCGTGRAGLALDAKGLSVLLVDCCVEALDPAAARLPFYEANLWELDLPVFDWIYCVDVLEHLPTEHIEAALDHFATSTRHGGFLQIALFEDHCGRLIGETLHLTIQSYDWWREKVAARWILGHAEEGTDVRGNEGYAIFLIGAPR